MRRCAERGARLLLWLWGRPETEIAVVAHGGLFHYLLNEHPRVQADAASATRFGNCEMRTCSLTCSVGGGGGSGDGEPPHDAPVFMLSAEDEPRVG